MHRSSSLRPASSTTAHTRNRPPLVSTRALVVGAATLGLGTAAPLVGAPVARAGCWTSVCRAFVSNSVYPSPYHEWGPWAVESSYFSNHAHYDVCLQMQGRNSKGSYYFYPTTSYKCGTSPSYDYEPGRC
jgi:hypothetical protein